MKEKNILLHPTFKMLALILLIYGIMCSALIGVAISINADLKPIFGVAALSSGIIFIIYVIVGFITMIFDFIDDRKERGLIETLKRGGKMLSFIGTIISSFINFIFSLVYLVMSYANNSRFFLYVSIFYLLALIIKVYLLSSVYETNEKKIAKSYVLTSIGTIIMSLVMAAIVSLVVFKGEVLNKHVSLLVFTIIFAIFKAVSAYISFLRHKRKASYIKLSLSIIAIIFAIFSFFTIHVEIIMLFTENKLTSLLFTGYPFALGMLVIGILSLVNSLKVYKGINENIEVEDSF